MEPRALPEFGLKNPDLYRTIKGIFFLSFLALFFSASAVLRTSLLSTVRFFRMLIQRIRIVFGSPNAVSVGKISQRAPIKKRTAKQRRVAVWRV